MSCLFEVSQLLPEGAGGDTAPAPWCARRCRGASWIRPGVPRRTLSQISGGAALAPTPPASGPAASEPRYGPASNMASEKIGQGRKMLDGGPPGMVAGVE